MHGATKKTFLDICGIESLGSFLNRHVGQLIVCIMQHLHYIKGRKHGWRLANSFNKLPDLWQPSGWGHFLKSWRNSPSQPRPSHCRGFAITLRHITLFRTPLDEWSVRRRDLYLIINNTQNRQTSMPPAGFEPAFPASEWLQTRALYCVATGIGVSSH